MEVANLVSVLMIIGLVWLSAFFQFSILLWTALIGAALILLTSLGYLTSVTMVIIWVFYLVAALLANLHGLRERFLIKPALKKLQSQMPAISATEREALEAGNTWWEKELFCGRPHWPKLFDIPQPALSQDEQQFLDNQVNHLCNMLDDWNINHQAYDMPENVWNYLKQEKFFGLVVPKRYGGREFSALAHSTIVVKIATRSLSVAVNTMVPNSLGPAELLVHYGTDAQKDYYLPRLASGEEIPCFALTSPEAGSDAGSIPDTGVICRGQHEGKEVIGIRLTFEKRYITLAPVATVLGLAFQLSDPEHLLGKQKDLGITLALIPTNHPGVETGTRHYPLHLVFMNGPVRGKDVFIPLDWIIGGTQMAGQGWRMLMECLSIGRSISLPALATACTKAAYRCTGAYARVRRQFNTSISSFEGIEEALGVIAGYAYQLEAARVMTAGAVDLKVKPSIASAIAKYHMTEMARVAVNHAMDIHAGHGIQVGPRNMIANAYMGIPISITVEGANILTRNLIIFGQGAIRCHPYILNEVELITAENPDTKKLDRTLLAHIGYSISNVARSLAFGLTGGFFIRTTIKNRTVKKYQRQLTRMSAALALIADTSLIILGGSLKRRERLSARMGDIMSQLYLASATLKYFHDYHEQESDVNYVCWCLQSSLHKIQIACDEVLQNFPNRFIAAFLSIVIFPFGRAYAAPTDELQQSLMSAMLSPSALRDRLTRYFYVGNNTDDITARLDKALSQVTSTDPLWKKLRKAQAEGKVASHFNFADTINEAEQAGVLTPDEARIFSEYYNLQKEIIKVNEFSFDLTRVIA